MTVPRTPLSVVGGTKRRTYVRHSRREKLAAVMASEVSGVIVAAEQTGVPERTIRYWRDKPEFAAIVARTREAMADDVKVAAHLTWERVIELAPTMEARDAIFAAEKAATILQLLQGRATERTETRDITESISPDAMDALSDEIDGWLLERKAKVE